MWRWINSDVGLLARIALGVLFFATLAVIELVKRGRQATRWREYLFLVAVVLIALAYGVANDQITCRVSWEYYYYGKELAEVLGPRTPPAIGKLSWEAAKVGMKATWTVGLIVGVALLLANNPNARHPQLGYGKLITIACRVVLIAATGGMILGWAGSQGYLARMSEDFTEMLRRDEMRPLNFMTAYGIHLGGYIGGFVGAAWAVLAVRKARKRYSARISSPANV